MKGYFLKSLLIIMYVALIEGFTLKWLFAWFVARPFHIHALTVPEAIGVAVLVGMLTDHTKIDENYDPVATAVLTTLKVVTALVIGGTCYIFTL